MPHDYFDETVASVYDEELGRLGEPELVEPVVELLAGLAGGGSALELGIGTGRDAEDLAEQGLVSHHFGERDGTLRVRSTPFRYVWPSELDLMARLAGLGRRERWGGWKREPFASASESLVAVWEKPA